MKFLPALVVAVAGTWLIHWLWLRVTAGARNKYQAARTWATDKRAALAASRPPDPPPSGIAAKVGAVAGGLTAGVWLAWRAGWPGFRLGWDTGRARVDDWWRNRWPDPQQPTPATTAAGQPLDLTYCPTCGYDLADNSWPTTHTNPKTGKACGYDWAEDDRWQTCTNCGGAYPPGIDVCGDCDRRVAAPGSTRWDTPDPQPQPDPGPSPAQTPAQPPNNQPTPTSKGTKMPVIAPLAEINTIADLRKAADTTHAQALVELEDAAAAVARAKTIRDHTQTVAERSATILDNDPAAAAACANLNGPAVAAYTAAVARQQAAQAALDTAAAARTALAAHTNLQGAVADTGGKASSNTGVYQPA